MNEAHTPPSMRLSVMNFSGAELMSTGALRVAARLRGEIIEDCDVDIGFQHRGFEKLAERLRWEQLPPYVDRLDWLAALSGELAYALALESLMEIEAPPRARWLRLVVVEVERAASHLYCLGLACRVAGSITATTRLTAHRETLLQLLQELTSARLMHHYIRAGGVASDASPAWTERAVAVLTHVAGELASGGLGRVLDDPLFRRRTRGIGVMQPAAAHSWAWSGCNLRACGVASDLRAETTALPYDELGFEAAHDPEAAGDCFSRFRLRATEIIASLALAVRACEELPAGAVMDAALVADSPLPAGQSCVRVEAPRGATSHTIVSTGAAEPFRLRTRAPSFFHLASLSTLSRGHTLSDLPMILASLDIQTSEVDR